MLVQGLPLEGVSWVFGEWQSVTEHQAFVLHSNLYPGFIEPSQCPETASKEHSRRVPLQLVPPGASR